MKSFNSVAERKHPTEKAFVQVRYPQALRRKGLILLSICLLADPEAYWIV